MREIETRSLGESLASREILRTHFGGLTISGKSGTGKTTTMETLADLYGITRVYKGGQTMRETTNVHGKRAQKLDRDLDKEQAELIQSANEDDPFLDEGRLAGFLATKEIRANPNLNVVRVLFIASSVVRTQRLLGRRLEKAKLEGHALMEKLNLAYQSQEDPAVIEEMLNRLTQLQKIENSTYTEVKKREKEREDYDNSQWKKVHPQLKGIDDVFHPSLAHVVITPGRETIVNKKGVKFYDVAINTNGISVEDTAQLVNAHLIEVGKVEKVTPTLSQGRVIFKA